jgi:hypothetical protein
MPDVLLIGLIAFAAVVGFVAVQSLVFRLFLRREPDGRRAAPARISCTLVLFTIVWSTFILTADALIARNAYRQARTLGFAEAAGEVRSARVAAKADDEGTSYDADIEYAYRVGDGVFTATRVRYVTMWGHAAAVEFVAAHPPGSRVTVYYDPNDPAEAVLVPGLGGPELFLALFMLPFNLVLVGLWAGLARGGHIKPPDVPDSEIAKPPASPAHAAAGILFVGPLIGTVLVAFFAGMPPSTPVMVGVWAVILAAAGFAYRRQAVRVQTGSLLTSS